jgi:nicotinamidase-related amidase
MVNSFDTTRDRLTVECGPHVLNRPEGAWKEQGILEKSAIRSLPGLQIDRPWVPALSPTPQTGERRMIDDQATTKPTLVLVDIQREYTTSGRPFYLRGIAPSLANCRLILEHARRACWPMIHVQHVQDGPAFCRDYARFEDGFEPLTGERVFLKSQISPYTSDKFKAAMISSKRSAVLVIGYGSTMCCLSTMISESALARVPYVRARRVMGRSARRRYARGGCASPCGGHCGHSWRACHDRRRAGAVSKVLFARRK